MHAKVGGPPDWWKEINQVTVDGRDVTMQCYEFDTETGVAKVRLQRDGKPYLDPVTGEVASAELHGAVSYHRRTNG